MFQILAKQKLKQEMFQIVDKKLNHALLQIIAKPKLKEKKK